MKQFSVVSALIGGVAIGVALVSFAGCKGKGVGGGDTVAVVNGVPISQDEYLRYMMLKPNVTVMSNNGPAEARATPPIGFQAFNDLVKQKLVVQMAKDEGVYPTPDEITKEIEFRTQGDPNFVKNLTAQGLDTDMIKQALAVEMSQTNLLTKGITVTDDDVAKYIKDNPAKFTEPPSFDLQWILVKSDDKKKQVDTELKNGQPFDQTAMRFSESASAKEMKGAMPQHHLNELPAELRDPISKTPQMKMTDWIKAPDGWARFYVVRKTPASPIPITDRVKELVRRQIKMQRATNASEIGNRIQEKLKQSDIQVKLTGLDRMWDQYMTQLKAATAPPSLEGSVQTPATGGAPAAAPTAAAQPAGGAANTGK